MRSQSHAPAASSADDHPRIASRAPNKRRSRFRFSMLTLFVAVGLSVILYLMLFFFPSVSRQQAARLIAPSVRAAQVGGSVFLGVWEQDNDKTNGPEPIEWIVLSRRDDRCLLMSRFGLDCIPFNDNEAFVAWDSSSILDWLNHAFYYDAFNAAERVMLLRSEQPPDQNPYFDTAPGAATHERIFLANITEVVAYLPEDADRQCEPTPYAVTRGVNPSKLNGNCRWWLRTPGFDGSASTRVLPDGRINFSGGLVHSRQDAIRPFVWVTFEPNANRK